jgi:flagellar basal-body rod protein FlgB
MLNKLLFGKTITPLVTKCLDAYSMRHKAIATNIANVEVRGYHRRIVNFEDDLKNSLKSSKSALLRTDEKHIPPSHLREPEPAYAVDKSHPKVNAINNVDIDMESADMAKNQIDYSLISTILRMEYQRLRMAIRGQ